MEAQRKYLRRSNRKNREAFLYFLDELHDQGKLHSMSSWLDLFSIISNDDRFSRMLGQAGSTPLDLFKFYVEDLKARFHDEKKTVKEILKDKGFIVEIDSTFEKFAEIISTDKRAATLDAGNIKLTYNSLIEKAEAKEKERLKEDARKQKRLEQNFKQLLKKIDSLSEHTKWDDIKAEIEQDPDYQLVQPESERQRLFNEYMQAITDACSHHQQQSNTNQQQKRTRKEKKKKRQKSSQPTTTTVTTIVQNETDIANGGESGNEEQNILSGKKKKEQQQSEANSNNPESDEGETKDSDAVVSAVGSEQQGITSTSKPKKSKKSKKKKKRTTTTSSASDTEDENNTKKKTKKKRNDLKIYLRLCFV